MKRIHFASNFENKIIDYLKENKIRYFAEYKLKELPYRYYDFYLPDSNTLIEADGQQHFEFVEKFHKDKKGFKASKNIDKLKTRVAKKIGFKLIRIDWTMENNFYEFLDKAIKSKKKTIYSNKNMYNYLRGVLPDKYKKETLIKLK